MLWVEEPKGRGTFSILSSCFLTLSLCVWTAVHLDVPEHGKIHSQVWRRVKWMAVGLLAPEVLMYVAWTQRRQAIALHTRAQALLEPKSRRRWTFSHSFYACMGGYAIDTSASSLPRFIPDQRTRTAVTADGICFILEHEPDLIPHITENEIKDKSKSSTLAKVLVISQTAWFCANVISRFAQEYHVTLLELTTLAHALCAIATYIFWWHKPVNVDEPTLLTSDYGRPLFAYMCMASGGVGFWSDSRTLAEFEAVSWHGLVEDDVDPTTFSEDPVTLSLLEREGATEFTKDDFILLKPGVCLPRTNFSVNRYSVRFSPSDLMEERELKLSWSGANRWALAAVAIRRYNIKFPIPEYHKESPSLDLNLSQRRTQMTSPAVFGLIHTDPWSIGGFIVASILYAGVHATAWDNKFPSPKGELLWKLSIFDVLVTPPFALAIIRTFHLPTSPTFNPVFRRPDTGGLKRPTLVMHLGAGIAGIGRALFRGLYIFAFSIFLTILIGYPIARGFLVTESVIEVFSPDLHIENKAFDVPNWTLYFPHFS